MTSIHHVGLLPEISGDLSPALSIIEYRPTLLFIIIMCLHCHFKYPIMLDAIYYSMVMQKQHVGLIKMLLFAKSLFYLVLLNTK